MKKINFLSVALIVVFALSCSKELENPQKQQKLKIELGTVTQNLSGGRTDAVILTPSTGTFNAGNTMNITWSFLLCLCNDWTAQFVNIEIWKGAYRITRIASNISFIDPATPGAGKYNWVIPSMVSTGSDFFIRIINTANSTQIADSQTFSLVTPSIGCYFSEWRLLMPPIYNTVPNNTTLQWQIKENGLAQSILTNNPSIVAIVDNSPINIIYNGTTYYCPTGYSIIPINGTTGCSGINPIINVPLTFQKIGGFASVRILLQSVSPGHYIGPSSDFSFYVN
jgi:hypothetical protein